MPPCCQMHNTLFRYRSIAECILDISIYARFDDKDHGSLYGLGFHQLLVPTILMFLVCIVQHQPHTDFDRYLLSER